MSNPEFKHLRKEQLKRRVKVLNVVIYLAAALAIASFVFFFVTDYKYNWSWLLIGLTYTMLPINFFFQKRRLIKEIAFRDDRLKQKQAAGPDPK